MNSVKLNQLTLVPFDGNCKEHYQFLKRLLADNSITKRFGGLLHMLINSSNGDDCFNKGFFVLNDDDYVGYIDIGQYNISEKAVYLRCAVVKEMRNLGYGSIILDEVSNYIFANHHEVKDIKLKTAIDNEAALKTIESCGFNVVYGTLYSKSNPYYDADRVINLAKKSN